MAGASGDVMNIYANKFLREIPPHGVAAIQAAGCERDDVPDRMSCLTQVLNSLPPGHVRPPFNKKRAIRLIKQMKGQLEDIGVYSLYCNIAARNIAFVSGSEGKEFYYNKDHHACNNTAVYVVPVSKAKYRPYIKPKKVPQGSSEEEGDEKGQSGASDGNGSGSGASAEAGSEQGGSTGNAGMLTTLFDATGSSGLGQKIECPSFFPKIFCDKNINKYNPLHYKAQTQRGDKLSNEGVWPPKYSTAASLDLGADNVGTVLDSIYQVLKKDFRKQIGKFLMQVHMEKYLEAALVGMGAVPGMEEYKKLVEGLSCDEMLPPPEDINMLGHRVRAKLPVDPSFVDSKLHGRAQETILAGHCMEAIEKRIAHIRHLFAQDAPVFQKILDPSNSKSPVAQVAIATASNIPVIGKLLSNAGFADFTEDSKRICGRLVMLASANNAGPWGYVDPSDPSKIHQSPPRDGWNRASYCNTSFRELQDLLVEAGRIYNKYPVLGEYHQGKPLYQILGEKAGEHDSARNRVRSYNRDYHFVGSASKGACVSNFVDTKGEITVPPSKDAMFYFEAGASLWTLPYLRNLKKQMSKMCEKPDDFIDAAIKNPSLMGKFFNCARPPFPEFSRMTKAPLEAVRMSTVGHKGCQDRHSMTWLACRAYKDVKEDDGIGQAISMSLMAMGELANFIPGASQAAGLTLSLKSALVGGAFSGLLTVVTAKSRQDLIDEQEERRSWVRAGLGSYDDYVKSSKAIIELDAHTDPKIIEIIGSVLGGMATGATAEKDFYKSGLFKDSMASAGPKIWEMSKEEIWQAIRERAKKLKETAAKMKEAAKDKLFGSAPGIAAEASLKNFLDKQAALLRHTINQFRIRFGLIGDDILEHLDDVMGKSPSSIVAMAGGGKRLTYKLNNGHTLTRYQTAEGKLVYQTVSGLSEDLADFGMGRLHQTNILTGDGKPGGFYRYHCHPPGCSKISDIDVQVNEALWGKGVYNEQMDRMLRDHPDLKEIDTQLIRTNLSSYKHSFWGTGSKERAARLAGGEPGAIKKIKEGLYNVPEFKDKPVSAAAAAFEHTPAGKWRKRNGFCTRMSLPGSSTTLADPPPQLAMEVMRALWDGKVTFTSYKCH